MIDLLCHLLEQPEPVISCGSAAWAEYRSEVEQLLNVGAMKQSDPVRSIACPACDEHHYVRVEYTEAGAFRAFCYNAGFLPIDAVDLTVLQMDIAWLIGALRSGINVLTRPAAEELVPGHLWFLGERRIRAYRTRFYFGWRLIDLASIEQAMVALATKPATMPGLVLTKQVKIMDRVEMKTPGPSPTIPGPRKTGMRLNRVMGRTDRVLDRVKKTYTALKNVNRMKSLLGMDRIDRVFPGTRRVNPLLPRTASPTCADPVTVPTRIGSRCDAAQR